MLIVRLFFITFIIVVMIVTFCVLIIPAIIGVSFTSIRDKFEPNTKVSAQ